MLPADASPAAPSRRFRVVVLDDYAHSALSLADWGRIGDDLDLVVVSEHVGDEEAVHELLRGADAVVAMRERTPLPRRLLTRLPRLRLIVTTGARNASIDPPPGVVFCGTRSLTSPTVELTWALILAARRHLLSEVERLRGGGWQATLGEGLEGASIGIVGLGSIGRRVGRVASAFGMRTLAWSANLTPEAAAEEGAEYAPLDELCARAEIVSVHTRLSDRTRRLIGVSQIEAIGPSGLLVNTSRAEIVDQQAMIDALHAGRLGGVALDVFEAEPLAEGDALRDAPRTLLSPHLGYVVRANFELFYTDAVEAIVAYRAGAPIRTIESQDDGVTPSAHERGTA
ncbi:D-2-hydroxyacid dehydrogenase family protein [Microbacterium sp. NPDC078428]|uniref:D-2-hydroxyacid dehydrogenase family protein n=1 Tax=Microbacterium sp. NPDC078428 TaxID=3364190 RepID=UPI0037CA8C1E